MYCAADARNAPIIVMVHGYTGFKDWGSLPAQCTWLAERGMATVAFNFSHNGIDANPLRITDLARFADNTVSRELAELRQVVDTARAGLLPAAAQCDRNVIFLIGHSRGGAEAIIVGRETPHVVAVATWGSISYFDRWNDRQKAQWRADGRRVVRFSGMNTSLEMSVSYLGDLEEHAARFDVARNVAALAKPLLLVHGAQDFTVLPAESKQLYDAADRARTELVLIPAAGHTFGAAQPFEGLPAQLVAALERTLDFFQRQLNGSSFSV